jgi:hypothetical protein
MEAEERIGRMQERHERATCAAKAMAAYFCEDLAKSPVEAMAVILCTFCKDISRCALQNRQSQPQRLPT